MDELRTAIASCVLFSGADPDSVEQAAANSRVQRVGSGELLRGGGLPELMIVLSGTVQVRGGSGGGNLPLAKKYRGDPIGAAALFGGMIPYTGLYATCQSELILIPRETISEILASDKVMMMNFISFLSGRVRYLTSRISALAASTPVSALAGYLLSLGAKDGESVKTPGMSAVAARLDIGRTTLYRAIASLEASGAVRFDGKTVFIHDSKILTDIEEGNIK